MTDEPMEPMENGDAGQMPDMRVEDGIRFSMNLFADMAWIKLGIRAAPGSADAIADLPQARLAIDALSALVQLTESRFDPHEVRDLKNLLAGLQMNYARLASGG